MNESAPILYRMGALSLKPEPLQTGNPLGCLAVRCRHCAAARAGSTPSRARGVLRELASELGHERDPRPDIVLSGRGPTGPPLELFDEGDCRFVDRGRRMKF